jgi:hypothetical protein
MLDDYQGQLMQWLKGEQPACLKLFWHNLLNSNDFKCLKSLYDHESDVVFDSQERILALELAAHEKFR